MTLSLLSNIPEVLKLIDYRAEIVKLKGLSSEPHFDHQDIVLHGVASYFIGLRCLVFFNMIKENNEANVG